MRHTMIDTIACTTCGKPMPDMGAVKQWCAECSDYSEKEAIIGEIAEEIRCAVADHVYSGRTPLKTKVCEILRKYEISETDNA